jgi:predicted molibdopterin-dependent oxidoreductase YjgC
MEVVTSTAKLNEWRRMQLMLLLRTHPLLCPSCDAAGDCKLQDLVHEYEVPELPFPTEQRYFHVDNKSHFIRFNMNLCIKCGMCVRICDEVQGVRELSFVQRGMHSEVSTDFGRPLDCEFCGQCAQVCPVGAIASKWLVGTGREFELRKIDTTCAFCSLGCTLTLGVKDKKVVWVSSHPESHNDGNLCVKGRYGWPYVYSVERLNSPLIRKEEGLDEAEWNEALSFVAERFNGIKESSGPLSLAALGSERLTNEEAYVFGRFVRTVMESPYLDHAAGYGYRGLADGLMPTLGYPASTNSIKELGKADLVLLVGADLTESHPVAKNEIVMASARKETKVIVIDPMRTKLSELRGTHLAAPLGSEHLIVYAMLKEIIDRELFDKKALDLRAEGFDELAASLEAYTPDHVGAVTGVDPNMIRDAASAYAETDKSMIVLTEGMNRMGHNVRCALAAANLALVAGRIGKESAGVMVFGEKTNAQGAIDMGLCPDLLPGFKSVSDEEARARFEQAWESPLPEAPGMNAEEILTKAESGEIRGLYIVGENPLDTYPDRARIEQALAKLEFLVVQDMFETSTAKMAHAVLPVTAFAEKSGTFTSAERLVQRVKPVLRNPGAKSDLEIFIVLAALMGKPSMTYVGPEQVMDEIAGLVDVYGGISYDRIEKHGITWPCVDPEDPGQEVLYEGGFPNGKASLVPAPPIQEPERDGLPMTLIPSTLMFHSGSFTEWSPSLMEVKGEGIARMNPHDVKVLGLKEGDRAKITSAAGSSIEVTVAASSRAVEGTVVIPHHFPAVKLNSLTRWEEPVVRVNVEKV